MRTLAIHAVLIAVLTLTSSSVSAQFVSVSGNRAFTGRVDLSGTLSLRFRQGPLLPSSCAVGDSYLLTAAAPYTPYYCTASNTWTAAGVVCGSAGQILYSNAGNCSGIPVATYNPVTGVIYLGGGSQPGIHLYSELPSCNQTFTGGLYGVFGTDGAEFTITDSSTNVINAAVNGGGIYSAPVRCDGPAGVYRVKSGANLNGINLGSMMLSYDTTSLARMFLTPLTANTGPTFSLVPTGTATGSTIGVRNSSDPNNYGHVRLSIVGTEARLILSAVGTGSAPTVFKFWTTSPIGAGLVMPTAADLKGGFQSDPYTPSSSTEPCTAGRFGPGTDGNFYVCTATNTWKRVALSSFAP